jgi:hypothetical protein
VITVARNDGRGGRQYDQRQQQYFRNHPVKRVLDRGGIGQHQRALAEIVDQQRRQHEIKPRGLDRLAPEMTQIRIERFTAGDREEYRAQRHHSDRPVRQQELDSIQRIDRGQHRRIVADMDNAHDCEATEPDDHDRSERRCHPRGTAALNGEQHHQDKNRQRHYVMHELRCRELEAFDRG